MSRLKRLEADGYDLEFLVKTQPIGNVKCYDTAIRVGNMWTASMYVYHLSGDPNSLWLLPFTTIEGGLVTVDIATQDEDKIVADLDKAVVKAMRELLDPNKNSVDKKEAKERHDKLESLLMDVRKHVKVMKFIKIRIHFAEETQSTLEKKLTDTRKKLEKEGFGLTVCLMEQREELQSRFLDYTTQNYLPNRRVGLDIASLEFGHSFPFNNVFLHDERGDYIGKTRTQGQFIFDRFATSTTRTHYNIAAFGKMGVGKSTFLKKLFQDDARKGYLVYGFDKSGEYTNLIKYYNGKIIRLDGQEGRINLFEILPLATDLNNNIDQQGCYTQHITRLTNWYSILKPKADDMIIEEFKSLLTKFYHHYGFINEEGDVIRDKGAELPVTDYPILSDFIKFVKRLDPEDPEQQKRRKDIALVFENLLTGSGRLFNGHTQIENVDKEQIIFFNIEGLVNMESNVAAAQIFSATTMFYALMIKNGKEQMKAYKNGMIQWDYLRRSSLFIDECHNLLNINNLPLVEFVTTLMREARKMLISIVLSTQSVSELVSQSSSSEQQVALQKVFEFCQYVAYFNMKSNALPLIKIISSGQLSNEQIDSIGRFIRGEFLMSFDGNITYEVMMDVTREELQLFDGGGQTHG